jgi:hypothetical protein
MNMHGFELHAWFSLLADCTDIASIETNPFGKPKLASCALNADNARLFHFWLLHSMAELDERV